MFKSNNQFVSIEESRWGQGFILLTEMSIYFFIENESKQSKSFFKHMFSQLLLGHLTHEISEHP